MQGQRKKRTKTTKEDVRLHDRITNLEQDIFKQFELFKKSRKTQVCEHMMMQERQCEPYDQNTNYYDKFWKTFMQNLLKKALLDKKEARIEELNGILEIIRGKLKQHKRARAQHRKNHRPNKKTKKIKHFKKEKTEKKKEMEPPIEENSSEEESSDYDVSSQKEEEVEQNYG